MTTPHKGSRLDGLLGLTIGEAKIILLGTFCTDENGKIDTEKLARKGGYKNAPSASTTYRYAKRKFFDIMNAEEDDVAAPADGATAASAPTPTPTPKKGGGRRKKADAVGAEGGEEAGSAAKPKAKRARKTPVKKGAAASSPKEEVANDHSVKKEEGVESSDNDTVGPALKEEQPADPFGIVKSEGQDHVENDEVKDSQAVVPEPVKEEEKLTAYE